MAFENIKRIMTSLPCLKNVDYESADPLWLFTDASGTGLGAALCQGKDWPMANPIAYESRQMLGAERNYPVHEQELLAVVHALQKWCMLLLGMKVNIISDHHSLTYLLKQRSLSRCQARWLEQLADFGLKFQYVRGPDNLVADALSRKDIPDEGQESTAVDTVASLTVSLAGFSPKFKAEVPQGYELNKFCSHLQQVFPLREDCYKREGLLFPDSHLVIPSTPGLRENLMREAHTGLGHLGFLKTVSHLQHDFFWPRMAKGV